MNIYRLIRKAGVDYDENSGFVVTAPNEGEARKVASRRKFGDEPPGVWLDSAETTCELVGYAAAAFLLPHIVLTDFNAG